MLLRTFKTLSSLRVSLRPNTAITAVLRNTFSSMEKFDGEFRGEQEHGHSFSRHSKYADRRDNRKDNTKEFDVERFQDQENVDIKTETIQLTRESPATESVDEASKLENFDISIQMVEHLKTLGITSLFPIQAAMFQYALDGKDLIARDKTGSGKTLSYALPLCEKFRGEGYFKRARKQKPLGLVILPTRELVIQVTNVFNTIKLNDDFRVLSVYGGTEIRSQIQDAEAGVEFIVGTPGRLIDLIKREAIDFSQLKTVVLDEADRMLDMGFQEDIEKIYEHIKGDLGNNIQTMLFSATIPDWVVKVAKQYLKEDTVTVDLLKNTEWKMPQTVQNLAIKCPYKSRYDAIGDLVLCYGGKHARTIIFTETKKEANDVMMEANIKQECQVLHGDIPQNQREITFRAFREGKFKCLIATDVAARGLDIPEVDLVVQLSPPRDVDTYIHRAGRTARAGRNGVCVTFYSNEQMDMLNQIQKEAKFKFKMIGAPQPEEIIKASSRDIAASIKSVPHDVVGMFHEAAAELIEDLGAEEALCRALAIVTGTNQKIKQRSMISSAEGYITYSIETPKEVVLTKVWQFLKGNLGRDVTEAIKSMKLYKDRNGAAFDVPAEFEEEFLQLIENNPNEENFLLQKATSLPDLAVESRDSFRGYNNDRNDRNDRFGNRRNSFERDDRDNRRSSSRNFREDRDHRDNRRDDRRDSRGNRDREVSRRPDRELTEEDRRKIFVAGLPYEAQEEDIKNFFDENDLIAQRVHILKSPDGNSKGTAFVVFEETDDVSRAMNLSGQKLMKRSIRIEQVR